MRRCLPYCVLALVIASCGTPEQPQAAPPTMAPLATIVSPSQTIAPTTTPHPTSRPATPLPDSANPPFTQTNIAIPLDDLLFQPGDLPDADITAQLDPELADWAKVKLGASSGAVLSLDQDGTQNSYGHVEIFFYKLPGKLKNDYRYLLSSSSYDAHQVPQQGIGAKAMLVTDIYKQVQLIFTLCRTIVHIRLRPPADQQAILIYGTRLAQRVNAVDCQHAIHAPLQTPAPVAATATPVPAAAIVAHTIAQVSLLPDAEGATSIRAYTFADIDHGWLALGATILATSDGGTSWHKQYHTTSKVKAITFVSAQRGWIATERGYVSTEDGGATWQPTNTPPNDDRKLTSQTTSLDICSSFGPNTCSSISAQIGWRLSLGDPSAGAQSKQLLKTEDGGQNWQLIANAEWAQPGTLPITGYARDLFFLDEQHGWFSEARGWLYATNDGGRSWHFVAALQDGDTWIDQLLFLSPTQGFAVAPFSGRETLFRTTNGTDWQPIYTAPSPPFPEGPTRFFNDGGGIGVSSNDTILKTADNGASWARLGETNKICGLRLYISGLSFPDQQNGWITGNCGNQSILYRTRDGGTSWTRVANLASVNASVTFVDAQTGYVIDEAGQLWRSDDGGVNLTALPSNFTHMPNLSFATRDTGWKLRGHQLFATHDGGNTWIPIGLDAAIRQFWLLPDGHAWALADGGDNDHPATRLFTTADGGQTWSESVLPGITLDQHTKGEDKITIQFVDDNHGWLQVGWWLYTTQDGGQSWVQLH